MALHGAHRLLGGEYVGFRVDIEGVLSLKDAGPEQGFDPDLFTPPLLARAPKTADLSARALVHGKDLYRGVALIDVTLNPEAGGVYLTGRAYNHGTELASITRLTSTLFDLDGQPVWVQADFLEANLIPGQEQGFAFALPPRDSLEILNEIPPRANRHRWHGHRRQ